MATAETVPQAEIENRLGRLQQALQKDACDGVLIVQKTDFYYFTGTAQQGWLYVPEEGQPLLMVFKDVDRAAAESPLPVISLISPKKIPDIIQAHRLPAPASLGLEMDVLPASLYLQYQTIFSGVRIVDYSTALRLLRVIKSEFEVGLIRQAAVFSDQVAQRASELLREGLTEVALAGEIEGYARSLGHQGIVRMRMFGAEMFYGHLLSGPEAATPSYLASPTGGAGVSAFVSQGAGFRRIGRHEPVLLDFVFAWQGYLSDCTRVFSIGALTDALYQAHQAMLDIQTEVCRRAVPGVRSGDLYESMIELAAGKGYGDSFMGNGERKIRFTGHGVGLELDEFPFIAKGQTLPLQEGMVIALEPKMILPGQGVVGIENTHLVTATGLETLNHSPNDIVTLPMAA